MHKRRLLLAGFAARMGEERLPEGIMFGELVGGEGYSSGGKKDWIMHLKEDLSAFETKFVKRPKCSAECKQMDLTGTDGFDGVDPRK